MRYLSRIFLFFILTLTSFFAYTQDILGGEIITNQTSSLTYNISVFLYTKTSIGIDHSSILISTNGGGSYATQTGTSTILTNDVTEWSYSFNHTYPGSGTYSIAVKDSFRIANIINITNSSTEKILLQKDIIINPFWGINNSPVLQSKPTAIFINSGNFIHNPNAIDVDGDSLAYSLVPISASNYSFPVGAIIDSITGGFSMPLTSGGYAIGIKIDEWRLGTVIGSILREMIIDSNLITSISLMTPYEENIRVFPNPNNGNFIIDLGSAKNATIEIYSISGQLILKKSIKNITKFDLMDYSKGIYFIRAETENKVTIQKISYQ